MGIQLTTEEHAPEGPTEKATIRIGDESKIEAEFHKCPETGEVHVVVADDDDRENLLNKALVVVLNDGSQSTYIGSFNNDGVFQPATS